MLLWFGSDRRPEAHQMVYGEEDRVFRFEHLSSAATYQRSTQQNLFKEKLGGGQLKTPPHPDKSKAGQQITKHT